MILVQGLHPDLLGPDVVLPEQEGQVPRGESLAGLAVCGPGPVLQLAELLQEGGRQHLLLLRRPESLDVGQQDDADLLALVLVPGGQGLGGLHHPGGPVAPQDLGNGEERFPVVGLPIPEGLGHARARGLEVIPAVLRPPEGLAAPDLAIGDDLVVVRRGGPRCRLVSRSPPCFFLWWLGGGGRGGRGGGAPPASSPPPPWGL